MSGPDEVMPVCPVCGEECNQFYVNYSGDEIVGCEGCIHMVCAYERTEADRLGAAIDYHYDIWKERNM